MIFLIGATGYLGRYVLNELIKQRIPAKTIRRRFFEKKITGVKTKWCNLSNAKNLKYFLKDVDGIIHTASPRVLERKRVVKEGILGTSYLIDYWKKGNFVYASSQVVVGIPPKEPFNEDIPYSPIYWYDMEKICCELLLKKKINEERGTGFDGYYIIFRIPLIFTPGFRMDDRQFLYSIIQHTIHNQPFVFEGNKDEVENAGSSWVDARDLAKIMVDSLFYQESGIYNIANGFIRWVQLLEIIKDLTGSNSEIIIQEKGSKNIEKGYYFPISHSELDTSRIVAKGFISFYSIQQTLSECVKFYLKNYKS